MFNHINTSAVGGSAIRFFNTQMTNTVHCNQMDTCRIGVRFDASNIGDQGSGGAAQENTWFFPLSGHLAFYRDNLSPNPNWFTRTLTLSLPFSPQIIYMFPTSFVNYFLGNATNDCEVPCPGCPYERMADIALRNGEFAYLTNDEYYALSNDIYNALNEDGSLMYAGYTSDVVLQNFYDSLATTNIGMLSIVNNLLADSLNAFAGIVNNWVVPVNHQEENFKLVNEIYLNTWAIGIYYFNNNQQLILESIANENPMIGGDAVYSARVLLGCDMVDFIDNVNRKTDNIQINSKALKVKFFISPNPADHIINVYFEDKDSEAYSIEFKNVLGESLIYKHSNLNDFSIDIEFLSNGIYLAIAYLNGNYLGSLKLVINK
ncbi:MAG: T9SS type A sorting domain-containing protein [Bacteroidetes bacterium]|nr:T9SS type A sorting domain-containing protein [Bacteroidota bacterium]